MFRRFVVIAAAFIAGLFSAKAWDRPVAGTLRWEVDPTLFAGDSARQMVSLDKVQLESALSGISNVYGRTVVVGRDQPPRQRERLVSIYIPHGTLMDVLDILQSKYQLFAIGKDDAIQLFDEEVARTYVVGRVYEVSSLIDTLQKRGLSDAVKFDGGSGRQMARNWIIRELQMRLIDTRLLQIDQGDDILYIRATPMRHQRIAELLNDLARHLEARP